MNREKVNAYAREYERRRREEDPTYSRLRTGANRAMWAGRSMTGPRILEYWESVGIDPGRCFYTGEELDGAWEVDHRVPISRGETHTIDNLVPCTRSANRSKADLTAEE